MYQKEREQDDVLSQNTTFGMSTNIRVVGVFVVTEGGKIASFCGHSWGIKSLVRLKLSVKMWGGVTFGGVWGQEREYNTTNTKNGEISNRNHPGQPCIN